MIQTNGIQALFFLVREDVKGCCPVLQEHSFCRFPRVYPIGSGCQGNLNLERSCVSVPIIHIFQVLPLPG